jgi:hypothetical protein
MIEPILLGGGKRLFLPTATGVLICTYRPADR